MVSETKLDDSFPEVQFLIEGFHSPFRFDRNINGDGIMLCRLFANLTPLIAPLNNNPGALKIPRTQAALI